jgi:putative tributyrin esterase
VILVPPRTLENVPFRILTGCLLEGQRMESHPRIVQAKFHSASLSRIKTANVVLPEDYHEHGFRYPVLYLLHGYGGNRNTWLNNTDLLRSIENWGLIVVLPESGRRWFINDAEGYRYEDYLRSELIPFVDSEFRTISQREGRGIAGFSMGGAAAVLQALRHPELFSVTASHSGAFEACFREGDPYAAHRDDPALLMPTLQVHERVWGSPDSLTRQCYNPYTILEAWDRKQPLAIYLDIGTEDYDRMLQMNRRFHECLVSKRILHEYHEIPGRHDWQYLSRALGASIRYIVRNLSAPVIANR